MTAAIMLAEGTYFDNEKTHSQLGIWPKDSLLNRDIKQFVRNEEMIKDQKTGKALAKLISLVGLGELKPEDYEFNYQNENHQKLLVPVTMQCAV